MGFVRQAVDDYIREAGKKAGEYLFVGRRGSGRHKFITYARTRARGP